MAAQVALSIFLVTAAAVFLNHLERLRNFDLGFRSDHVLLVTLDPDHSGYKREQLAAPYQELLARMETIPQVRSASISGCTPLQGCGSGSRYLIAEGHMDQPENRQRTVVTFVAPRYFETLGIPLLAGRDFAFRDAGRSRVAIVNQAMARHYFPGANPIGKHVAIDRDPKTGGWFGSEQSYEIIGLTGDAKAVELREAPYPTMYFNMFQESRLAHQFELRTTVDPESVAGTVRRMVRDVLKTVPVTRVTTLRRPGGLEHCSRASDRNALRVFRLPGRGACRHRPLRAAGLYGRAADERDRDSDGVRGDGQQRKPACAARRLGNGVHRIRGGGGDGALEQTAGNQPSLRFEIGKRGAAGDRRRGNDCSRTAGLICTGAAGGSCGPDGGTAARIGLTRIGQTVNYQPL